MAVTADQILSAYNSQQQGQELQGADRALAGLLQTPDFSSMDVGREDYYSMDTQGQADAIARAVNARMQGMPLEGSVSPSDSTSSSPTQPTSPSINTQSRPSGASTGDDYLDISVQPADQYFTSRLKSPYPTNEPVDFKAKADNNIKAGILNAYNSNKGLTESLMQIYQEGGEGNSREKMVQESHKKSYIDAETTKKVVQDNITPDLTNQAVVDTIDAGNQLIQKSLEEQDAYFTQFVDAFGGSELEDGIRDNLIANAALYDVASRTFQDAGWWDKFYDVARSFVPGMDTKDALVFSGGNFNTKEFSRNFIDNFRELSHADKMKAIPVLEKELKDKLPDLQAGRILQYLASPTGEIDTAQENDLLESLSMDVVDLAPIVLSIGAASYGVARGLKAVSIAKKAEAADTIATAAASRQGKAVAATGLDEDSLATTMSPFKSEWLDNETVEGLSNATIQRLKAFELRNRQYGESVEEGRAFNRESFLTDEQAELARRNVQLEYENTDGLENVQTTRKGDSIEIYYEMADENGNINSWEETLDLTLDDVQEMVIRDPGTIKRHTTGALTWSHGGDFESVVQSFIRQESGNARALNQLRELQEEAYEAILGSGWKKMIKSFSPKQRRKINRIDDVLLSGDESQRVYTVDELRSGIVGHKLDDDEIETYYKLRTVLDNLFFLRNQEKRRELGLRGIKEVTFDFQGDDALQLGKPMTDAQAASNSVSRTNTQYFYDDAAGEQKLFSDIDITSEYVDGKVLVRLDQPKDLGNQGNKVRYALVDADSINELPDVVLHRRVGYVPKVNNESAYFVKVATSQTIDGEHIAATQEGADLKTVRAFNNKKEADAWTEEQNRMLRERGITPEQQNYIRLEDRQLELERTATALDSPASVVGGGLYTGPRSSEEILWGAEGLKQPRANAFEATSRALTSVAKYVSMNQLRLGAQERALRTANMLVAKDGNPLTSRFQIFDDLRTFPRDTENGRKIGAMYDYIQDALGFATTEERLFQQSMQNVIDNSGLAAKMPGFRKTAFYLKSKDPIAAARAAAFQGMLGWFNPVQLWVQAQGAAVAASMNITSPVGLGRALRNQFGLQALQYVDPSSANFKHVAKALGMKADDLAEMKTVYDKTGLADSILTTADHAAAEAGYGVTLGAFRRMADKGLFFYRGGELFNRRFSFVTAFDEWKKANNGAKVTDEGMRQILTRSNNLMLNMNRANRASYQKGIWSLPTQFSQINFRTMEALLGVNGNFTVAERAKILAGQAALYGAAGVPLGNMGAHWLAESFGYTQEELEKNVSPEVIKAANEGFLGWLTMEVFGVDVEVGERSSLIGGLQSFTSDLLFAEGTVADKLFGAFGNIGGRFWSGLMGEYEPLSLGMAESRSIDVAKAVTSPILGSISTFRNIDKAYFMNQFDAIVDKNWEGTLREKFALKQEIATAIGFSLKEEQQLWDLRERNKAAQEYRKKVTNEIVKLYHQYGLKSMNGQLTQEDKDSYGQQIAILYQTLGTPYQEKLVRENVQKKLTNGGSSLSKEWLEYRRVHGDGEVNGLFDMMKALKTPSAQFRSGLSGGGLLQEGGFEGNEVQGNGE